MADSRPRIRIVVPQRVVSGGLDSKFETDPYDVKLHGLMTSDQYTEAIENLNEKLRKSRAGKVDGVLLASSIFVVPVVLWGVRHNAQTKKRKRLLKEGIHDFNTQYPGLLMRWNRRPQSTLTIEARAQSDINQNAQPAYEAEARVINDVGAVNYEPHQVVATNYPPLQQFPPQQQQSPISLL